MTRARIGQKHRGQGGGFEWGDGKGYDTRLVTYDHVSDGKGKGGDSWAR